ncbi:MAG: hypothetical protein HQL67_06810 [Magnetococcales bacterium]|nr:hypothetical protein [Magnetococcales bacterium]
MMKKRVMGNQPLANLCILPQSGQVQSQVLMPMTLIFFAWSKQSVQKANPQSQLQVNPFVSLQIKQGLNDFIGCFLARLLRNKGSIWSLINSAGRFCGKIPFSNMKFSVKILGE